MGMQLTDQQLNTLIMAGYSDVQIMEFIHQNNKPSDLYGAVADVVTAILHDDPSTLDRLRAADPEGALGKFWKQYQKLQNDYLFVEVKEWWRDLGIGRSDTKSIVMTYLYGSTEYGNRDSIQERIEERALEISEKALDAYNDRSGADVWKEQRKLAVTVMVRMTRGAMAVVCPSTVETMDYIQESAFTLGQQDIPFKFSTPLNFTVWQDNPNTERKCVEITENGKKVMQLYYRQPVEGGKLYNEKKMEAGSAPNFVHAHDACHLQYSTLLCNSEYFHHIHDSMGTQCADTPALVDAIRDSWFEMYGNSDILYETYDYNNGAERNLKEPKELGDLDIEETRQSIYFFS